MGYSKLLYEGKDIPLVGLLLKVPQKVHYYAYKIIQFFTS